MKDYTDEEISRLITCDKVIVEPPRKDMRSVDGHKRNGMKLQSKDGNDDFTVFMRVNEAFPENFSIGLVVHPKDVPGDVHLLRCNGPHGDYNGTLTTDPNDIHPHFCHHVHKATEANIRDGFLPERTAVRTKGYAAFEDALTFFVTETNILGIEQHIDIQPQLGLFTEPEAIQ